MQHVYPGAIVRPSPAAWTSRNGCEIWPLSLILHGTQAGGGTAEDVANVFATSDQKCSHFLIGKDGKLWQFADPLIQAAAANSPCSSPTGYWDTNTNGNWYTVSIEIFKIDNGEALTESQWRTLLPLVDWICDLCKIPKHWPRDRSGGICSHGFFSPGYRSDVNGPGGDPGTFDWNRLWNFLEGGGLMLPQGWKDDGKTLTAPNGHTVKLGFREYVLTYPGGWPAGNQPLEEEWHADPLEISNPNLPAGQKQCFNRTTLEWTPERGVFEAYQGQEIFALRMLIARVTTPPNIGDALTQAKTIQTAAATLLADLQGSTS